MAKKKITVEEGGKLNESVSSHVNADTENNVNNANKKDDMGLPELTEEQKQYARITVRNEFNKKFSKWAEIDPEDATDDDIAAVKKDFEDCVEENKNKTYLIATHEDGLALKTAEFLQNWNKEFNT